jgi:hypothetical protein
VQLQQPLTLLLVVDDDEDAAQCIARFASRPHESEWSGDHTIGYG